MIRTGRGGAVFVINRATAWINSSYILNNSSDDRDGAFSYASNLPAINYCYDSVSVLVPPIEHDLDMRDRDQVFPGEINDPPNPAPGRLYDLGAYVGVMDRLFRDRFESE
jgi:hypothetical protein